jgi:hypothetical protein
VTSIVDPDIDPMEVMHDESHYAINLFAMANVACEGQCLIQSPNACPRSLQTAGIA